MSLRYVTMSKGGDSKQWLNVLSGVLPLEGAYAYVSQCRNIWELHFSRDLRAGEVHFLREVIEDNNGGQLLDGPVDLPALPDICY